MLYFNIDFGVAVGPFQLEVSFMLRNWELTCGNIHNGIIKHVSLGPIHVSITNRKKLKELVKVGKIYVKDEE